MDEYTLQRTIERAEAEAEMFRDLLRLARRRMVELIEKPVSPNKKELHKEFLHRQAVEIANYERSIDLIEAQIAGLKA